jgi:adenylate cyclase
VKEVERAFLFADLSGFTALTEAHGDLDAATVAARFVERARSALLPGARIVKTIGDEVMIVADDVRVAVQVALALYRAIDDELGFPTLRAGLHTGSCVERDADYFGAVVNLAARVSGQASPGQILCTEPVMRVARDLGIELTERGEHQLKNLSRAVALWELRPPDRPVPSGVVDPVCRMRVDPATAPARLSHAGKEYYFCATACAEAFASAPERYRT